MPGVGFSAAHGLAFRVGTGCVTRSSRHLEAFAVDPATMGTPSARGSFREGVFMADDRGISPAHSPPLALQHLADSLPDDRSRTLILVVDDTGLGRERLKDELSGEGYRVTTAQDGEEALARVAAEPPDL